MTSFPAILLLSFVRFADAAEPSDVLEPAQLRVVAFTGELRLQVGSTLVELKPGSPAYAIPRGAQVRVVSGRASLLLGEAFVSVDANDGFRFAADADSAGVEVLSGMIAVTSKGETRLLRTGETMSWPPGAPLPVEMRPPPAAVPPPVEVPPAPPQAAPPVEVPPPPVEVPPVQPPPVQPPPVAVAPLAEAPLAGARPSLLEWLKRPGIRIQIELHPYYALRETYDSNIYRVAPDKPNADVVGGGVVGAWITQNDLGLKMLVPFNRRHKLDASYDFKATNYSRFSAANDSYDQTVRTDYAFDGARGLSARAYDSYMNTMDPAFSESVTRARRWQNSAGGRLEKTFSRSLFGFVEGDHTVHKYLSGALGGVLNRYEQFFGAGLGVMVGPKTRVYGSYRRTIIHYSAGRQANNKGHAFDAGIEGQLTAKLKGKISAGVQYRRYDSVTGSVKGKATSMTTGVDLAYKVTRRANANLRVFRNFSESTFGANRFYTATGVSLGVQHGIGKLSLGAMGSFEVDNYPESTTTGGASANRRDDLYSAGLTAGYSFRQWLSSTLSYTRLERHSIFTRQFNYGANLTALELKVQF